MDKIEINKIYNVDMFDHLDQIESNSVDCFFTDPPYDIKLEGGDTPLRHKKYIEDTKKCSKKDNSIFFSDSILDQYFRILKEVNIFLFCSKKSLLQLLSYADRNNFNFEILTFNKKSPTPFTNQMWLPDKEFGVHIYKTKHFNNFYDVKSTFYVNNTFRDVDIPHPTPKPLELVKKILRNISLEGHVVFDPFVGSGTTVNACINLNRRYLAFEKDKKYFDYALERSKRAYGNVGLFEGFDYA